MKYYTNIVLCNYYVQKRFKIISNETYNTITLRKYEIAIFLF